MNALGEGRVAFKTPKSELMTARQTCRFLKIPQHTLYRYLRSRRIPAFKLGNEWRFVRSDLEQWTRDDRTTSPVGSYTKAL